MDIAYTSEFDDKRYEMLIRKAVGLVAFRVSYFCWCMAVFGGLSLYSHLARHHDYGGLWVFVVLAVNPLLMFLLRWLHAHRYMKILPTKPPRHQHT